MTRLTLSNLRITRKSGPRIVSVAIVLITLTANGRAWFTASDKRAGHFEEPASIAAPLVASDGQDDSQTIEAEVITIRATGFEPATITRDKGNFLLVVHNRSGLREVVLRLDREVGGRLHDVRVPREKLDWGSLLDLNPGRYVLTEANHPGWACHIVVTAH